MKRLLVLVFALSLVAALVTAAPPQHANNGGKEKCTTIQSGELLSSSGDVITTGYNDVGYNYQAHLFNGMWGGDYLVMKWNDAWLSNKDCDGDGLLDRHLGYDSYIGSGAWVTNHFYNEYTMQVNETTNVTCNWEYFVKIVAVPQDAMINGTVWYTADGVRIGESIWNQFAIIQEEYYDSCDADSSYTIVEPRPGLGNW